MESISVEDVKNKKIPKELKGYLFDKILNTETKGKVIYGWDILRMNKDVYKELLQQIEDEYVFDYNKYLKKRIYFIAAVSAISLLIIPSYHLCFLIYALVFNVEQKQEVDNLIEDFESTD
jgi:hypothetical protein